MYLESPSHYVAEAPDRALLYLSLHLLMDGLIQRQQALQCAENYSVRNSLGKLLRLHRSMSLRLVDILQLDMQRVEQWPSLKQIVTSLPAGAQRRFSSTQRLLENSGDSNDSYCEDLARPEHILVGWLRYACSIVCSPRLKALIADMIAAWQICLEGINSELLTADPR
ncbi:hypothetical protein L9G74_11220 [Shewanella sp. C32]|uniref:Uncharacterized protein n=1 Tax=Shewanella electrica TaxID=515560 RepID=A0ABT2FP78_9GAMM|nr:hypothetical protein [Shewanella electrica]MCH1923796.1 hypothetical protein [Shewanella electrica]MCS4557014.1 hypothetical protein [Shewanella electrica]